MVANSLTRAVAKISSCQVHVYAISRRGIVQLGSSFCSIFLLFPTRAAGNHPHSCQGNPQPLALSDSPGLTINKIYKDLLPVFIL